MVEAKKEAHSLIEVALGLRRSGGDREMVGAETVKQGDRRGAAAHGAGQAQHEQEDKNHGGGSFHVREF